MKISLENNLVVMLIFATVVLTAPIWLSPNYASYPDLLQKFAIFGIFAIGLISCLASLVTCRSIMRYSWGSVPTAPYGHLSLFTMNVLTAIIFGTLIAGIFALVIGFLSLRRSGIYFSILTLAFAQMSYSLAYSVLTPITNGETGLQLTLQDPRYIDSMAGIEVTDGLPSTNLFGLSMSGYSGFYVCAVLLIIAFYISLKIFRSPFGLKLTAIKSNQTRMRYTCFNTKPYLLSAFVISGMFAGLAGSLMAATDPLAGAERMQWTASGEVVLMTILGGTGTLIGPLLGVGIIKYFENIFSALNPSALHEIINFLPQMLENAVVSVTQHFVGEGWHLTLGALFMLVVIFLPGGVMQGINHIISFTKKKLGLSSQSSVNDDKISQGESS